MSSQSHQLSDPASFFMSEHFSDVEIHVGWDLQSSVVIPGHKVILAGACAFFESMFNTPMRESFEGVVKINENAEDFVALLKAIYSGQVEDQDEDRLAALLILSDKYVVPKVFKECDAQLRNKLSCDNAVKLFELSRSIGVKGELAKKSWELILRNKSRFLSDAEFVVDLATNYPEFLCDLCCAGTDDVLGAGDGAPSPPPPPVPVPVVVPHANHHRHYQHRTRPFLVISCHTTTGTHTIWFCKEDVAFMSVFSFSLLTAFYFGCQEEVVPAWMLLTAVIIGILLGLGYVLITCAMLYLLDYLFPDPVHVPE